jgi:probable HAF family extracellular repeat protein
MGINELGHIVGALGPPSRAAVYREGVITRLPVPEDLDSVAYDINAQGTIIGDSWNPNDPAWVKAFRYAGGTLELLGELSGGITHAEAINAAGTIVGNARLADGSDHAVRYDVRSGDATGDENSDITDLGTLGCGSSAALGINGSGQIVGYSSAVPRRSTARACTQSAFLFAYGMMYDLNDYLAEPIGPSYSYWWLTRAGDINDHGQIVVDRCSEVFSDDCRAMLLTPVE